MKHVFMAVNPFKVRRAIVQFVTVDVIDLGFVVWVFQKHFCNQTVNVPFFTYAAFA